MATESAKIFTPPNLAPNGWTAWTRDPDQQTFSGGQSSAAIQSKIDTTTNAIGFDASGSWDYVNLTVSRSIDLVWSGSPTSGSYPKLNTKSDANAVTINPGNSDIEVRIIGLHFDGRETGDAGDDWRVNDRRAIRVQVDADKTGSVYLIIEDCVFDYFDTFQNLQDLIHRLGGAPSDQPGRVTGYVRRCTHRYCDARSTHSVGTKPGGMGNFWFLSSSYDQIGYINDRDEDDPRGASYGPNANKAEHGIYGDHLGAPFAIQACWFSRISAQPAQQRAGGWFDYNIASQTAEGVWNQVHTVSAVGNLLMDTEDITSLSSQDRRGKGHKLSSTRSGTPVEGNIFLRKGSTLANQPALEIGGGADQTIRNNVTVGDWGGNGSKGIIYNPGKRGEYAGIQGNRHLPSVDDSGWPAVDSANINLRYARKRGQWRPLIDHVASIVNPVRELAQAAAIADGGDTYLPQLLFSDNIATPPGPGGLNADNNANIPPSVAAGADQVIVQPAASVSLAGTASDPDGTIASSLWEFLEGPATPTIVSPTAASTSVTGLSTAGNYVFRLTVTDDDGASTADSLTVQVNAAPVNNPPVVSLASSGSTQLPGAQITLTATDSDTDGTIVTRLWEYVGGASNAVAIDNATTATATASAFTTEGDHTFRYTATDDGGATTSQTVSVSILAVPLADPPTCDAGQDAEVLLPHNSLRLAGTDSASSGYAATQSQGDLDGDGDVDDADLGIAFSNFTGPSGSGKTQSQGDLDGDGDIDDVDLGLILSGVTGASRVITTRLWEYIGGASRGLTIQNADTAVATVTGIQLPGPHTFRYTVTDQDGLQASDTVTYTFKERRSGTPFDADQWSGYASAAHDTPATSLDGLAGVINIALLPDAWKSEVQADGEDIRVTTPANDELPHYVASWSYNNGKPTGYIHFRDTRTLVGGESVRVWCGYRQGFAAAYGEHEPYGARNITDADTLGYWLDGSGRDRSTTQVDAPPLSTAQAGFSGPAGVATAYDGVAQYAQSQASMPDDAAALTVSCWVRPDAVDADDRALIGRWGDGEADETRSYLLQATSDASDKPTFSVAGPSGLVTATGSTALTVGQWSHLAGVYAGSDLYLYLNGVQAATASANDEALDHESNLNGTTIGAIYESQALVDYFGGRLAGVRIDQTARSAAWLAAHASMVNSPATYWGDWSYTGDGQAQDNTDYKPEIEAAMNKASGSYSASAAAIMRARPMVLSGTSMDMSVQAATALAALPDRPADTTDTQDSFVKLANNATGTIAGVNGLGVLNASGNHSGLTVDAGDGAVTLDRLHVRNASFEQVRLLRPATLTRSRLSSEIPYDASRSAVSALRVGQRGVGPIGEVVISDLEIGLFYGSPKGQAATLRMANAVRVQNMRTPVPDGASLYSVILGEGLGYVRLLQCGLPHQITHDPDITNGDAAVVDRLVLINCDLLNVNGQDASHDQVMARHALYINCRFFNIKDKVVQDQTPAGDLVRRVFVGCYFQTDSAATLISHDSGASALAGRIAHANCTFVARGGGSWSLPSDWAASEIALPPGYSTTRAAELLT